MEVGAEVLGVDWIILSEGVSSKFSGSRNNSVDGDSMSMR